MYGVGIYVCVHVRPSFFYLYVCLAVYMAGWLAVCMYACVCLMYLCMFVCTYVCVCSCVYVCMFYVCATQTVEQLALNENRRAFVENKARNVRIASR